MPPGVRVHGILLKQAGESQRLIPYMLAGASLEGITEHCLRCMLATLGAPVVKRKQEKSITKRTLLWSLILATCASMTVEEQTGIFLNFFGAEAEGGEKDLLPDEIMQQALNALPFDEVRSDYAGLKDRLDRKEVEERFKETLTREKGERARMEYETPGVIKSLKPEGAKVVLCMDRKNRAWEAYYPGGTPTKSISVAWSSRGRTMLSSLTYCIEYLWRNHKDKGRESEQQLAMAILSLLNPSITCIIYIYIYAAFGGLRSDSTSTLNLERPLQPLIFKPQNLQLRT